MKERMKNNLIRKQRKPESMEQIRGCCIIGAAGILIGLCLTFLLYRCFPQFLCYAVYDVRESDLFEKQNEAVEPGTVYTLAFQPQHPYLAGIGINVLREDSDDRIQARLYDDQGKLLGRSSFSLKDVSYQFSFGRWVSTEQEYYLEITYPPENEKAIETTFGPAGIGPQEQKSLSRNGAVQEQELYVSFIYNTYSKKLLAFWFLIFLLCGTMLSETIYEKRKEQESRK